MFVGHYAVSLACKRLAPKASLGLLFIAVQFVDILFFPFVLIGIESFVFQENFTESTHFDLEFMPYTHSLVAGIYWSAAVYGLFRLLRQGNRVALVMAIAVLSHWFADLIVHTPDLPLVSDDGVKLGLGLWRNAFLTYALEAAMLIVGLVLYLRGTEPAGGFASRNGMTGFVVLMLLINAVNIFAPPMDDTVNGIATTALVMYALLAGVAFWLDRKRTPVKRTQAA